MIAPQAPRSVFCVVVEVMWACGMGDGYTPPATRPATCAMSTNSVAPTESAIWRIRPQSMTREYAENPASSIFGRTSSASFCTES